MSHRQLDTWVWNSGERQEVISVEVVPELIRLDEVIWEDLEGKPYCRDGPKLG